LFGVQAAVLAIGSVAFMLWPQLRRLRDPELALQVEEQTPQLGHRLITAVELNQAGAQTEGMSEELIGIVTHEAEKACGRIGFAGLADHSRLGWGLAVLLPISLLAAVPALLWPELTLTLLQRQALMDVEVPRLVALESDTPTVLPIGEKYQILYRVSGP